VQPDLIPAQHNLDTHVQQFNQLSLHYKVALSIGNPTLVFRRNGVDRGGVIVAHHSLPWALVVLDGLLEHAQ
jgi:hypothetical protein